MSANQVLLGGNLIRLPSIHNGLRIVFSQLGAVRVAVPLEPKRCTWILVVVAAQLFVPLVGENKAMDTKRAEEVCTQCPTELLGRPNLEIYRGRYTFLE